MNRFCVGDKVIFKIPPQIKHIFNNLDQLKGVVVDVSIEFCVVYIRSKGFVKININHLDFRFNKDKLKFKKLGYNEYINYKYNSKVLTFSNNVLSIKDCVVVKHGNKIKFENSLISNFNSDFYKINHKIYKIYYNVDIPNEYITNNYIIFEITQKNKYEKTDYFDNTKLVNTYLDNYYCIFEFDNENCKIHFTKNKHAVDNLPRFILKKEYKILNDDNSVKLERSSQKIEFGFCISEENLKNNNYIESLHNGYFYHKDHIGISYNSYFGYETFNNNCLEKTGFKSLSFLTTEGIKYTFGIEIEMQKCFIPNRLRNKLNINCVRDGSINNKQDDRKGGPEFVTGVLSGDSGFLHLNKICNEITKRGELDQSCGLHVHIGGASFSEKFLVMSYILGLKLENEFYNLVPKSRRNSVYCSSLKNLEFNFDNIQNDKDFKIRCSTYYKELFKYLCGSYPNDKLNKNTNHPRGRTCNYDHTSPRYNWLNFVPAVFNTKGINNSWTLEFRIHSGTSNFIKIKNWIKLCMAFVYFADNYYEDIINNCVTINGVKYPLNVENIVNKVYRKSGSNLNKYLKTRKDKFNDEFDENKEYTENCNGVLELNNVKEILN